MDKSLFVSQGDQMKTHPSGSEARWDNPLLTRMEPLISRTLLASNMLLIVQQGTMCDAANQLLNREEQKAESEKLPSYWWMGPPVHRSWQDKQTRPKTESEG